MYKPMNIYYNYLTLNKKKNKTIIQLVNEKLPNKIIVILFVSI